MRDGLSSRSGKARNAAASVLPGLKTGLRSWLGAATIDDDTKVLGVVQRPDADPDSDARSLVGRKLCLGAPDCGCPFHEAPRADVPLQGRWPAEFAGSGLIGRVTIWPLAAAAANHGLPAAIVIPERLEPSGRLAEAPADAQLEAAAMVAHELRGPLSSLRGAGELALAGATDAEEERQLLELIMRQIERLDRLTHTLLEAFRLKSGSLDLSVQAVDIAALCEDVIADFESPNGTEIDLLREPAPLRVFLDEAKVRTILANLVGNAIKHSPAGGRILVRVETDERNVRVAVEDQGPGIPARHIPHIFDPFYQATQERRAKRGFGLGLHIARTLVDCHGGRIWVEAAPGQGTSFIFTVPARLQRPTAQRTALTKEHRVRPSPAQGFAGDDSSESFDHELGSRVS
jgi:signal transduction histidine kinase